MSSAEPRVDQTSAVQAINDALVSVGIRPEVTGENLDDILENSNRIRSMEVASRINQSLNQIASGIPLLASDDPMTVARGTMTMVRSVVGIASMAGGVPEVGAVLNGVLSVVGSVVGLFVKGQHDLADALQAIIDQAMQKLEKDYVEGQLNSSKEQYVEEIKYITDRLNETYESAASASNGSEGDAGTEVASVGAEEVPQADASQDEDPAAHAEHIVTQLQGMSLMTAFAGEIGTVKGYLDKASKDYRQSENVAEVMHGYVTILACKIQLLMQAASLLTEIGMTKDAKEYSRQAASDASLYAGYIKDFLPIPIFQSLDVLSYMARFGYGKMDTTMNLALALCGPQPALPQPGDWYNIADLMHDHKGMQLLMSGKWGPKHEKKAQTRFGFRQASPDGPMDEGWHLGFQDLDSSKRGPFYIL